MRAAPFQPPPPAAEPSVADLAGPPANENATHPDAALLALAVEFDLAERKERELPRDLADEHYDKAFEVCREIAHRIIDTPAFTMDGLRVKALVYLWCGHEPDETPEDLYDAVTTDVRVSCSVMRDLARHLSMK